MPQLQIIPFPPKNPTDLQIVDWMNAVTVYLRTDAQQKNSTSITSLPVLQSDSRASSDGILMYDPSSDHVVVSVSGEWKKLEFVP